MSNITSYEGKLYYYIKGEMSRQQLYTADGLFCISTDNGHVYYHRYSLCQKLKILRNYITEYPNITGATIDKITTGHLELLLGYTDNLKQPSSREEWVVLLRLADRFILAERFSQILKIQVEEYLRHQEYQQSIKQLTFIQIAEIIDNLCNLDRSSIVS